MMREVRIEDLRDPHATRWSSRSTTPLLAMEVDLDPADLVAAAQRRTGLDDLGDTDAGRPTSAQVGSGRSRRRAVRARAGSSSASAWSVCWPPRLRFEDFVRRHPEALEIELEPPVIVVGLPRSGTTHLVNLLATDPRFRSMPWWEVRERRSRCSATARAATAWTPATCGASREYEVTTAGRAAHRAHARPAAVDHRGGVRADGPRPVLVHAGVAWLGCRRGATTTWASTSGRTTGSCAGSCRCSATCGARTGGC